MKKINKVFLVLDIISACLLVILLAVMGLICIFSASIGKETAGNLSFILTVGVLILLCLSFIFFMCWNQDFGPTKKERLENLELRVNILEKEQLYGKKNKR